MSVARTWNVWLPSARAEYVLGLEQAANAAPSREHWKVEPGSLEEKSKVAPVAVVSDAGALGPIEVLGGVASIVQAYEAGLGSWFPAGSTARAWKVCAPSASPEYVAGFPQAAKAAPSRLHWNVEPDCVAESPKLGLAEFDNAAGLEVIAVSGATVSIVQP